MIPAVFALSNFYRTGIPTPATTRDDTIPRFDYSPSDFLRS
jgi:hypothetical protein